MRESAKAKFYFFDTGAVRTLANRVRDPLTDFEKGPLLETLLLHELRSAAAYLNTGGEISYWRTPAGVEIDFIWARADTAVAIEVKGASAWRREYSAPMRRALDEKMVSRAFGVYLGSQSLREEKVRIFPLQAFLEHLWAGDILEAARA